MFVIGLQLKITFLLLNILQFIFFFDVVLKGLVSLQNVRKCLNMLVALSYSSRWKDIEFTVIVKTKETRNIVAQNSW